MSLIAEDSFENLKNITNEKYKLFNRVQESNKTIEAFYDALTAQAASSELGAHENELMRDLFTSSCHVTGHS